MNYLRKKRDDRERKKEKRNGMEKPLGQEGGREKA